MKRRVPQWHNLGWHELGPKGREMLVAECQCRVTAWHQQPNQCAGCVSWTFASNGCEYQLNARCASVSKPLAKRRNDFSYKDTLRSDRSMTQHPPLAGFLPPAVHAEPEFQ